jgi:hypothetical protein
MTGKVLVINQFFFSESIEFKIKNYLFIDLKQFQK